MNDYCMIESAKEYLLQMKAKKSCSNKIYNIIRTIHSYECFEFAIYNISSISNEYLKWIDEVIVND